jgi:hypothetical protein
MNDDEDFAASLRPESTFGALGSMDHFDDDEDEYEEYEDDFAAVPQGPSAYPQPQANAVGSAPVAVSGAPITAEPTGSKLGAAITLFLILGGAGLGWHYGRFKGAAGGALVAGALRNLYRTNKTIQSGGDAGSAVKQGIVGLAGVGGGGYLLWTANRK